MTIEVPIILVEQAGPIVKIDPPSRNGSKFRAPIIYTLIDGRRLESTEAYSRKKDLVAFLAALPHQPSHPTLAKIKDGEFWGTSISYFIGPSSYARCPHCLGAHQTQERVDCCDWRRDAVCHGCGNPIAPRVDPTGQRGLAWAEPDNWGDDRDFQCCLTESGQHEINDEHSAHILRERRIHA